MCWDIKNAKCERGSTKRNRARQGAFDAEGMRDGRPLVGEYRRQSLREYVSMIPGGGSGHAGGGRGVRGLGAAGRRGREAIQDVRPGGRAACLRRICDLVTAHSRGAALERRSPRGALYGRISGQTARRDMRRQESPVLPRGGWGRVLNRRVLVLAGGKRVCLCGAYELDRGKAFAPET